MILKNKYLLWCFLNFIVSLTLQAQGINGAQKLSLDKGWRFYEGDILYPLVRGHGNSMDNVKAGRAAAAAGLQFDDRSWRLVDLPHDWAVEQPFDSLANVSQGYKMRGIGWYRRNFKVDASERGKHFELQLDGISTHATIWFNGHIVHRNWNGYTSSYIDLTPFMTYDDEINNIAIRVDAEKQEGWWYEGAGIYRHTWLVKRSPMHIITDGVYANPVKVKDNSWIIPVEIILENSSKQNQQAIIEVQLLDDKGKQIVSSNGKIALENFEKGVLKLDLPINNPELWSVDIPKLYTVKTIIKQNGIITEEVNTKCGFRTIRFDANKGFFLNDKNIKIKGTCNHQDHAGVGVAVPNSLWAFRIKKLKNMGSNAYRCAHHPPAKEFLEACDSLGLLVMDENRYLNVSPEYQQQLEWMVRRDRNHPSIIMWSVFNEEYAQGTEVGYEMVKRMSHQIKSLDTTRYITAGANGGIFMPVNTSQALDVVGFNYMHKNYDRFHAEHPEMMLTSSEDGCAFMQRGVYATDMNKHLIDEYDLQKGGWGTLHREGWKAIAERPFIAGSFYWTGFDYHGEPSPFEWPSAGSNFGIMDQCGFPKTAYYIRQAQWLEDNNILHLAPHWNWPADSIGKSMRVMAVSNAERIKILLNGKVVGEQKVDKYDMNYFFVAYRSGKLEAIGYKGGKQVSHFVTETTGKPVSVQLTPDRSSLSNDGWDAVPVTVQVLDEKGRHVPTANLPIEFEISSGAKIIGLGNGDPNSHEAEKGDKRSLYNGLAQVILQSNAGATGKIKLIAKSPGLKEAILELNLNQVSPIPAVNAIDFPFVVRNWKLSPFTETKPDANLELADSDANTWSPVEPGYLLDFGKAKYVIFRTTFKPYDEQAQGGGKLLLRDITGKAEVWLNKKLVASKNTYEPETIEVIVPPNYDNNKLSILIERENGKEAGLPNKVIVKSLKH